MKTRFILSVLILLSAACAPPSEATEPPEVATELPVEALPSAALAAPTLVPAAQGAPTEEAAAPPVATSRGPDLHATDPANVSLASGGLQFVEFFRFT